MPDCVAPFADRRYGHVRIKQGDKIETFKKRHGRGPMEQIVRSIFAREDFAHKRKDGRDVERLQTTGRAKRMKMEPDVGVQPTSMQMLLDEIVAQAGADAA